MKRMILIILMLSVLMLVGCSKEREVGSWTNRYTQETSYSEYLDEWEVLVVHSYIEGSRQFATEEITSISVSSGGVLEIEFKDDRVQVYHGDYRFYFLEERE